MSETGAAPVFDDGLAPTVCGVCGQRVVLSSTDGSSEPACPLCKNRDASARALEEGAVAAGPWPRLVLARGAPLPGGELWLVALGGETELDLGEGPVLRLLRSGARVSLVALAGGVSVDGNALAPGSEAALPVGARVSVGARELVRA